jgi:hypothetical protein
LPGNTFIEFHLNIYSSDLQSNNNYRILIV